MRRTKSNAVMWPLLLVLLGSAGAYAVEIGGKSLKVQLAQAVADLQAPARRQGASTIGGVNWHCSGARCSASMSPVADAAPVTLCQGLAREAGAVRSFSLAGRALSGNELRQCNSVVPMARMQPGFKPVSPSPVPGAAPAPLPPQPSLPPGAVPNAMPGAQAMKPMGTPMTPGAKIPDAKMKLPPAAAKSPFAALPPAGTKPGKGFLPDTATPPASTPAPAGGPITVEANFIAKAKSGATMPGAAPSAGAGSSAEIVVVTNFIARPKTGSGPMGAAATPGAGSEVAPITVQVNYIARPKSR